MTSYRVFNLSQVMASRAKPSRRQSRHHEIASPVARNDQYGYTLIEITLVLVLISILALVSLSEFVSGQDSVRFEQTRSKMEAIRAAILGDERLTDRSGRTSFGYHGDVGSLPSSLNDLVTRPVNISSWVFHTTLGIGSGWRGPYILSTLINNESFDVDGWGTAFTYSTSDASLTTQGSDRASGGTGFAQDITVSFLSNERLSRVSGQLVDMDTPIEGRTVAIGYPVNGAPQLATQLTNANGQFGISNVPFGLRSFQVTGTPSLGPKPLLVEKSETVVPNSVSNFLGSFESIKYTSGSAYRTNSNKNIVARFSSSYSTTLQLKSITVQWTQESIEQLNGIAINNVSETLANTGPNTQRNLNAPLFVPAKSETNTIELQFTLAPPSTPMTLQLGWVNRSRIDSLVFTP